MFGKQHDSVPVLLRILLRQIPHRFHQQALAFDIARIRAAFSLAAAGEIRNYGNRKYLCHRDTFSTVFIQTQLGAYLLQL